MFYSEPSGLSFLNELHKLFLTELYIELSAQPEKPRFFLQISLRSMSIWEYFQISPIEYSFKVVRAIFSMITACFLLKSYRNKFSITTDSIFSNFSTLRIRMISQSLSLCDLLSIFLMSGANKVRSTFTFFSIINLAKNSYILSLVIRQFSSSCSSKN